MSGAEAAGLVLGILPLMISVSEHYGTAYSIFKRFKACRYGVRELLDSLDIQRTIFRAEIQLLLGSALGSALAQEMLDDYHHPKWIDSKLEFDLKAMLGSSHDAILLAVESIERMLTNLEQDARRFEATLEPAPPVGYHLSIATAR
jgi:hypothetical protein